MDIQKITKSKYTLNCGNIGNKVIKLLLIAVILLFFPTVSDVEAATTNFDNENGEDDSMTPITTITMKLHLYNFDTKDYDRIKIVGYLNGEGQVSYIDLKENKQDITQANEPTPLSVDLEFNRTNYISSVIVDDEYFVCAYALSNKSSDNTTNLPVYDCDEGNIGKSTTSASVKLFSTMKKYTDSNTFYKIHKNLLNGQIPDQIKILVHVPLFDAKDIDDMNVIGMIKGEYNILTVDVQNELNKQESENDRIPVLFTMNRETESGPIQPGDMFFGCVTSGEFPNQNSDCEKRILKDLNGLNSICARQDNNC